VHRGYQQCLASIVANLVANRLPGGVAYKVDEPLMKRLQVLLKDGNVDGSVIIECTVLYMCIYTV